MKAQIMVAKNVVRERRDGRKSREWGNKPEHEHGKTGNSFIFCIADGQYRAQQKMTRGKVFLSYMCVCRDMRCCIGVSIFDRAENRRPFLPIGASATNHIPGSSFLFLLLENLGRYCSPGR